VGATVLQSEEGGEAAAGGRPSAPPSSPSYISAQITYPAVFGWGPDDVDTLEFLFKDGMILFRHVCALVEMRSTRMACYVAYHESWDSSRHHA
jgi:hypothetical protein